MLLAGVHQICVDMEACSDDQLVSSVLVLCIGFSVPPCVAQLSVTLAPPWSGLLATVG